MSGTRNKYIREGKVLLNTESGHVYSYRAMCSRIINFSGRIRFIYTSI